MTRNQRLKLGVIGMGAALALAAGIWLWKNRAESPAENAKPFRSAQSFALKTAKGKTLQLEDLGEQWVVVHFWASWCAPCVEEVPAFLELARSMKNSNIQFIAISADENWEEAHSILPSEGLPENVISLLDPESEVSEKYGTFQLPESYLLSPTHDIVHKWVGQQEWDDPRLKEQLKKLVSLKPGATSAK